MPKISYWNHNSAYYPWIKSRIGECASVLDVGCGNGTLIAYLNDGRRMLLGIDLDENAVRLAQDSCAAPHVSFVFGDFLDMEETRHFDAVVFVASIHHMDMLQAVRKAKSLLRANGKLIIVGLAKPSTFRDRLLEALRVIPSSLVSLLKRAKTSEDLGILVSYQIPPLDEIRQIIAEEIPGSEFRQALHYRYLLTWIKKGCINRALTLRSKSFGFIRIN